MRFLGKDHESPLASEVYRDGGHNDALLTALFEEQRGFCAYSEYRPGRLDTTAIEHFDPRKKATAADGYRNYYGVMQVINQRKRRREKDHVGAAFFESLFFQLPGEAGRRIRYVPGEMRFEPSDPGDEEARALVEYLGFNDHDLAEERYEHVRKLKGLFADAGWGIDRQVAFLRDHPRELSFVTALAAELGLDADALLG